MPQDGLGPAVIERNCRTVRDHKPHLWSRTTRKTVTEETAGDTFRCPGKARAGLQAEKDERGAQIAADARSGRNWASETPYGSACVCGAFYEGSTVTSWGREVQKGECHRHGVTQASRIARNQ